VTRAAIEFNFIGVEEINYPLHERKVENSGVIRIVQLVGQVIRDFLLKGGEGLGGT